MERKEILLGQTGLRWELMKISKLGSQMIIEVMKIVYLYSTTENGMTQGVMASSISFVKFNVAERKLFALIKVLES